MLPDETTELRSELLDARKALDRIRTALGVQRTIPLSPGGYGELALMVETLVEQIAASVDGELETIKEDVAAAFARPAGGQVIGSELERWWGLSYAAWLTLPRAFIQAMPPEWQDQLAALLEQYDATFERTDFDTRVQVVRDGQLAAMPAWIANYRHPDRLAVERLRKVKKER
jgi:hypothetical protein